VRAPLTTAGFARMVERAGTAAKLPFKSVTQVTWTGSVVCRNIVYEARG